MVLSKLSAHNGRAKEEGIRLSVKQSKYHFCVFVILPAKRVTVFHMSAQVPQVRDLIAYFQTSLGDVLYVHLKNIRD